MKKFSTFFVMLLLTGTGFSQVVKSFTHPSGYGLSAVSARLLGQGYVVSSKYDNGTELVNYITRYADNGTVSWSLSENSGLLSGIADVAENSQRELYLLCEDPGGDAYYGLIKTDSLGTVLWSRNLQKNGLSSYDAPRVKINASNEVYVMSSTIEKTLLYKLDNDGNLLWSKTIVLDTVMTKNPAFGMETTPDGGVICSGKSAEDIFLQRFAADGTPVWTKRIFDNDLSYAHPRVITRLQDGNYLVAGFRGENTAPYITGMFLMKFDLSGNVLDYQFYTDSLKQYVFVPYALHELADGNIRVMGCGGVATFVDVDASLHLQRYSVWNTIGNLLVSAGDFDFRNGQMLVSGTDNNTTQYVLRNSVDLGDWCDQADVASITQNALPFDNSLYNTTAMFEKNPGIDPAGYALAYTNGFATSTYCGTSEITLGVAENNTVDFSVYPNPVSSGQPLKLELNRTDEARLSLVNTAGQQVYSGTIKGNQEINPGHLPAGMYYLTLSVNEKSRLTTKIIVY